MDQQAGQPFMTIWRLILAASVVAMAGFVGGVWFVSSGFGFWLIQLPTVPPAGNPTQRIDDLSYQPPRTGFRNASASRQTALNMPDPINNINATGGLGRAAERADLLPSPGCDWEVEPHEFRVDQDWHKSTPQRLLVGMPSLDPKTGQLRYSIAQTTRLQAESVSLRYVLFDAAGHRFPAQVSRSRSSGGTPNSGNFVLFTRHDWGDMPPTNVREISYFGVERVPFESVRRTAAEASAEAKQQGLAILPPPRLGEPCDFALTTLDGQQVRSADLKGKPVLIVLSGLTPQGPLALNLIRRDYAAADLTLVAVSFEESVEGAQQLVRTLGEPASLIMVPTDPQIRQLWRDGAELEKLPACWLIDAAGKLCYQGSWIELYRSRATLLGQPSRRNGIDRSGPNGQPSNATGRSEPEKGTKPTPGVSGKD